MALSPVCILAGGYGSRLGDAVSTTPKPLMDVAGEPFLFHQLRLLSHHGARHVVLCVGYLGERIEQVVGQRRFGLQIQYSYDSPELDGTAGAIRAARDMLGGVFHVLYGDTYLRIDYGAVERAFGESQLPALMTVLRNRGRWDTSNARFDGGLVLEYNKSRPSADMEWIDYGLSVMRPEALDSAPEATDLASVFSRLAEHRQLAGYAATERFYEIGTPEALAETSAFLAAQRREVGLR